MGKPTGGVITFACCVAVLIVAGVVALSAMDSYNAPTSTGRLSVRVDGVGRDGTVRLRTLDAVRAEDGRTVYAAGSPLATTVTDLVGSSSLSGPPAAGSMLSCDVRVRLPEGGDPVVDLVRCTPSSPGARG